MQESDQGSDKVSGSEYDKTVDKMVEIVEEIVEVKPLEIWIEDEKINKNLKLLTIGYLIGISIIHLTLAYHLYKDVKE